MRTYFFWTHNFSSKTDHSCDQSSHNFAKFSDWFEVYQNSKVKIDFELKVSRVCGTTASISKWIYHHILRRSQKCKQILRLHKINQNKSAVHEKEKNEKVEKSLFGLISTIWRHPTHHTPVYALSTNSNWLNFNNSNFGNWFY